MEQIMIDKIKNGYTVYQKGKGTIYCSTNEEMLNLVDEFSD